MAMQPIRIFEGSFAGATLYENPAYVSPNAVRRLVKERAAGKYNAKVRGCCGVCCCGHVCECVGGGALGPAVFGQVRGGCGAQVRSAASARGGERARRAAAPRAAAPRATPWCAAVPAQQLGVGGRRARAPPWTWSGPNHPPLRPPGPQVAARGKRREHEAANPHAPRAAFELTEVFRD